MATIRKLTTEEIERLRGGKPRGTSERARVAQEYDVLLASFAPDEYGEVDLEEGERKLTVRHQLSAAAKRRGWALRYTPTRGQRIRFQVTA